MSAKLPVSSSLLDREESIATVCSLGVSLSLQLISQHISFSGGLPFSAIRERVICFHKSNHLAA